MSSGPTVSILLPTYNRAAFLPAAFDSIVKQTLTRWELIIVDDGSTDDTECVVADMRSAVDNPVVYLRQENTGAYGARNVALDHASGEVVAFYDSDDIWLPHHLANCVAALADAPEVSWVWAACRIVDFESGSVIDANTFVVDGHERPFLTLRTRRNGPLRVLDDSRSAAWAIRHGLYAGLQNSVIRRSVFDGHRFESTARNEAEDQLFVIRALKRGVRMGYLNDVHVQYHVHDANSSAPASDQSLDRQLSVYGPLVRGFEALAAQFDWTALERRELKRRLGRGYFWHIGYALLWQGGRQGEALTAFRKGLDFWPWNPTWWKTYLLARLRAARGGS